MKIKITVTDITTFQKCQKLAFLKTKYKEELNEKAKKNVEYGVNQHKIFELQKVDVQDKRCFVASYAYGEEDFKTQLLRNWRDRVLVNKWYGDALIRCYYKCSPLWINVCKRSERVHQMTVKVLNIIVRKIYIHSEDK